jgi:hypothetical protein
VAEAKEERPTRQLRQAGDAEHQLAVGNTFRQEALAHLGQSTISTEEEVFHSRVAVVGAVALALHPLPRRIRVRGRNLPSYSRPALRSANWVSKSPPRTLSERQIPSKNRRLLAFRMRQLPK